MESESEIGNGVKISVWLGNRFSLLWCQRRQPWTSRLQQIVVCQTQLGLYCRRLRKPRTLTSNVRREKASNGNLDVMLNCMIDWYVIADVRRLNTFIMFMHLKPDPASYEGLFEKVNSSVMMMIIFLNCNKRLLFWIYFNIWAVLCGFPFNLSIPSGEILCHWDTGRVCPDNSGGGWCQENCLPFRNQHALYCWIGPWLQWGKFIDL